MKSIPILIMIAFITHAQEPTPTPTPTPEEVYAAMGVVVAKNKAIYDATYFEHQDMLREYRALSGDVFAKTKQRALQVEIDRIETILRAQKTKLNEMRAYMDAFAKAHQIGPYKPKVERR